MQDRAACFAENSAARFVPMLGRALGVLCAIALSIGASAAASAPPSRIVSLAPAVTETLFALGEGGAVVGVSQYCDYPPAATHLPKVGTFLTPNVEAIAALRPDVLVG